MEDACYGVKATAFEVIPNLSPTSRMSAIESLKEASDFHLKTHFDPMEFFPPSLSRRAKRLGCLNDLLFGFHRQLREIQRIERRTSWFDRGASPSYILEQLPPRPSASRLSPHHRPASPIPLTQDYPLSDACLPPPPTS